MSMESTSNLIFWGFFVVFLFHWVFSLITFQAQNKIDKGNNTTKTEKNENQKKYSPKEGNSVNDTDKINFENLSKQSINLRKRNFCEPNNIDGMDTKSSDSEVFRDHPKRHSPDTPVINKYVSPREIKNHEEKENTQDFNEKPFGTVNADSVFSQSKKNEINIDNNANIFTSKEDYLTNSSIPKNCFIDNKISEDISSMLQNTTTPVSDKVDEDFKTITDTILKNVKFTGNDLGFDHLPKTTNVVQLESAIPCNSTTMKDSHHVSKALKDITNLSSHSTLLNSNIESLHDLNHGVIGQTKLATHSFDLSNERQSDPVEKIEESFDTNTTCVNSFNIKKKISKESFGCASNDDLSSFLLSRSETLNNQKEFIDTFESTPQPLPPDSCVLPNTTDSNIHDTCVKIVTTNEEGVKETTTNKVTVHVTTNKDETSVNIVTTTDERTVKVIEANDAEAVKVVTISDEKTVELIEEHDEEVVRVKTLTDERTVERLAENDKETVNVKTLMEEKTVERLAEKDDETVKVKTVTEEKTIERLAENDEQTVKVKTVTEEKTFERLAENDEATVKVKTLKDATTVERLAENDQETVKVTTVTDEKTVERLAEKDEETIKLKTVTEDKTVERLGENDEKTVKVKTVREEKTVERLAENDEDCVKVETITEEKTVERLAENDEDCVKIETITEEKTVERLAENDEDCVKVETITEEKAVERLADDDKETVKVKTVAHETTVKPLAENDKDSDKVKTITHEKTISIATTSEHVQPCVTTSADEIDDSVLTSESICRSELSDSGTSYQVGTDHYVSDVPIANVESPEPFFQNVKEERQSKDEIHNFCYNHEPFECAANDEKADDEFSIRFSHDSTRHPTIRTFDLVHEALIGDEHTYRNIKVCQETSGFVENVDKESDGDMPNKQQDNSIQSEVTTLISNDIEDAPSISKLSKNLTFSEDEEKNLHCATESYSFDSNLNESAKKMTEVSKNANLNIMEPNTNNISYDHSPSDQHHMSSYSDLCMILRTEKHTGTNNTMDMKPETTEITHFSTNSFCPAQNNDNKLCQPPLIDNCLDSSSCPINLSTTKKDTQVLPETSQNTSDSQDMEKINKDEEDGLEHLLHKIKKRAIKRLNRVMSSTHDETNEQNWENSSFNRFSLDNESNESFDTEEDNDDDDSYHNNYHFKEDVHLAQSLKTEGNELFQDRAYQDAAIKYTEALKHSAELEFSAILLCNRAACYLLLKYYKQVIKDCNDGLLLFPSYVKLYLRRFRAYEGLKKWHEALADLDKIFELDPSFSVLYKDLHSKIKNLSKLQFEKEKEEMINNLKGFGNWALGKIGLSIDNFKIDKNEATGAYNVSFQNSTS